LVRAAGLRRSRRTSAVRDSTRIKAALVACVAGLVVWVLLVSILNRLLRLLLTGYAAAEPGMNFTLSMMVARLTIAAITSLVAGAVVTRIAPAATALPWLVGVILLVVFVPGHVLVWQKFPVWYHLTFLLTLVPLVVLGAHFSRSLAAARAVA
jgi:hypothetical protein